MPWKGDCMFRVGNGLGGGFEFNGCGLNILGSPTHFWPHVKACLNAINPFANLGPLLFGPITALVERNGHRINEAWRMEIDSGPKAIAKDSAERSGIIAVGACVSAYVGIHLAWPW
jgi:hypothetical protein